MFNFVLLISAILLVSIDFVYLRMIQGYFTRQIETVQKSPLKINYLGAAICYILLITALHYFIIQPKKSVSDAFLLGILIYGVYETTNYALFTHWSIFTVIIDTLWGGLLFASTTYLVQRLRF
jgi:uncharacterized membrane protein